MLILVAHGSHNAAWRASVERAVANAQRELGERCAVRLAYMDCTPPTLADVVGQTAGASITRIRVLPLFLANEGHVDRDIRPLVEQVRRCRPELDVELLPAMGQHPAFVRLLYEIGTESAG